MRFCQNHWNSLREAIRVRGLEHLVSRNGEDLVGKIESGEERKTPDKWDPLFDAFVKLSARVLSRIESTSPEKWNEVTSNPDWCPMCEVQASYDNWVKLPEESRPRGGKSSQEWIDSCCDFMLREARKMNLVSIQ